MRFPFVSAATYDWAIRLSERLADDAQTMQVIADLERAKTKALETRVAELTDIIVGMKKQNFVVDTPVTHTPLSVDEADEYSAEEDSQKRSAMLKRKLV